MTKRKTLAVRSRTLGKSIDAGPSPVHPTRSRAGARPARGSVAGQHEARAELCRQAWRAGRWQDVARTSLEDIRIEADRAVLSTIIGAAHSHIGDMETARRFCAQGLRWGCDREVAARIMIAALCNTLGQVAACVDEPEASLSHFAGYLRLADGWSDAGSARRRQVQELVRAGLHNDALSVREAELKAARTRERDDAAHLGIVGVELRILREELRVASERGQIYSVDDPADATPACDRSDPARFKRLATSQLGQDLWVLERSGYKRDGYFVEFGATDGVSLSNSWLLETEFGWRGLCAEPNPSLFENLQKNRRCKVSRACIGPRTGQEVSFVLADAFGTIASYADADMLANTRKPYSDDGRVIRLCTVSLEDFLVENGAPRDIDYLSIDTEGSEFDILNAFPFDRWRIRLLTVEHNFTPQREKIRALLERHGYRRTMMAKWDDWYELQQPA